MKKRDWRCPECGNVRSIKAINGFGDETIWKCEGFIARLYYCGTYFSKRTIQAIVGFETFGTFDTTNSPRTPSRFRMPWKEITLTTAGKAHLVEELLENGYITPTEARNLIIRLSKCECGSLAVGGTGHSTWCPQFEGNK